MKSLSVYVGFDPREADGFAVTRSSLRRHLTVPVPVRGLVLDDLKSNGLFYRPQEKRDGQLWDVLSGAPCATEFSISRFLTPILAGTGWAVFCDSDMLFRGNLLRLIEMLDPDKPVYCVHHDYRPTETVKMDGQAQTVYSKKNWSSFMVFNCDHAANKALTVDMVNTVPGRDLHNFCWLDNEDQVGEIDPAWNWLVDHSDPDIEPSNVHFTTGLPSMPGYEYVSYADEWRAELARWAA